MRVAVSHSRPQAANAENVDFDRFRIIDRTRARMRNTSHNGETDRISISGTNAADDALSMLSQLTDIGIEVRIEHGSLMLRGHGARPPPDLLERVRAHKRQLLMLLDGSTCRLCQRAVDWRHSAAVALADGTSVHHECRSSSPTRRLPATA